MWRRRSATSETNAMVAIATALIHVDLSLISVFCANGAFSPDADNALPARQHMCLTSKVGARDVAAGVLLVYAKPDGTQRTSIPRCVSFAHHATRHVARGARTFMHF